MQSHLEPPLQQFRRHRCELRSRVAKPCWACQLHPYFDQNIDKHALCKSIVSEDNAQVMQVLLDLADGAIFEA